LLDVPRILEYLAYLGYMYEHDSQLSAIHVTRDKKIDIQKKQTARTVFQCHVIGPKGAGKTAFLQGFLGRNLKYLATLNAEHMSRFAINTVPVYGQDKYLLLHEIDVGVSDTLSSSELSCDVACLLYDVTNPRSFEYCARLYKQYFMDSGIPCLVVACKAEQNSVLQDHELQPAQFCSQHKLPPPQLFTCIDRINKDVYIKLAAMAAYPNLTSVVHLLMMTQPPGLWLQDRIRHLKGAYDADTGMWLKVALGMAVATGVGYALYRYISSR